MTTTTTLSGQIIGEAEQATRALLDRLLARTGTSFHEWVSLNFTAINGGAIERERLIQSMVGRLKIAESVVESAISSLLEAGLMARDPSGLRLTAEGTARQQQIRAGINDISARLYGDLPADDLATASRVLTTVTARANAALAES